jgi:hypothetical protein
MLAELARGQDVELGVAWASGGHMVDVVGGLQVDSEIGIWFNDPDDNRTQTDFSWLTPGINQPFGGGELLDGFGDGNRINIIVAESTPEPSTLALCLVALVSLGLIRKRLRLST